MSLQGLPRISHPTFTLEIPSSGQKVTFRPMETRERKILLVGVESNEQAEIARSVRQVVSACVNGVDADQMTSFDLEWAFLQLIIHSIKDTIQLQVSIPGRESECPDCALPKIIDVDLRQAKCVGVKKDKSDFIVELGHDVGMKLKYPSEFDIQRVIEISRDKSLFEKTLDLISICVDYVYDAETTFKFSDYSYQDRMSFLESIDSKKFEKLEQFVSEMPKVVLDINVTCATCGYTASKTLTGLSDFFV